MGGTSSHQKLKCLKNHLKKWNTTTSGNVSQIKDDLLQKIQEMDNKEAQESLTDQVRSEESD